MNDATARVIRALDATRTAVPGHLENCLAQRTGPRGAGSRYPAHVTAEGLERALRGAVWEPYAHPDIDADVLGFTAPIPGRLGIVPLSTLPAHTMVTLDDAKGEGYADALLVGQLGARVDFTVILLGPEKGAEVVFTFHPGAPIQPPRVEYFGSTPIRVTAAEALKLGFSHAKIVSR